MSLLRAAIVSETIGRKTIVDHGRKKAEKRGQTQKGHLTSRMPDLQVGLSGGLFSLLFWADCEAKWMADLGRLNATRAVRLVAGASLPDEFVMAMASGEAEELSGRLRASLFKVGHRRIMTQVLWRALWRWRYPGRRAR